MSGQPTIAANAPNPTNEMAMLLQGYSPQTAVSAQRSQYLAQAMAAMRDQGQNIRTPVALASNLLAEALMQRKYGQSMGDFANAAREDQGAFGQSIFGGLKTDDAAQPPAAAPSSSGASPAPPAPPAAGPTPAPAEPDYAPNFGDPHQDPAAFFAAVLGGKPVTVTSGLRTPARNAAVGGSPTSSHLTGNAWDFTVPGMTSAQAVDALRQSGMPFDQLIDEGRNVHVGMDPRMRGMVMAGNGGHYSVVDHDTFGAPQPTAAGAPTYATQGQPVPLQPGSGPQSAPTPSPSPSLSAASPAPGGPASAPPAAASPAAGGAAPQMLHAPVTQAQIDYARQLYANPMTRQQGIQLAMELRQRQLAPIEPKVQIVDGQAITSDPYGRGPSTAAPVSGYRPNPTASIQGGNMVSYDPRDPTHPTITQVGLPTDVKPMMVPDGKGGYREVSTPLSQEKATQIYSERVKSEAYVNWANSRDAWDAMKANAMQPGGISAYALRDTFARIINPAGAVRLGTIKAIEETEGMPEQVKNFFRNLTGDGPVSPQIAQQILNAAYPFLKSHYDTATREQGGLVDMYRKSGWDPAPVTLPLGEAPKPFTVGTGGRPSINQAPGVAPFGRTPQAPAPGQPRVLHYNPTTGALE